MEGLLDPTLPSGPEDDIVTKHLENIYLRLNVQSRTEAIRAAGTPGFLDALRDLIGCDDVTLQVMDLDRRYTLVG